MSSEANLPEMSAPQAPPPPPSDMQIAGEGQQQQGAGNGRSRRRRRKRKKGGAGANGEGQQTNGNSENAGSSQASGEGAPQQQSNAGQNGGQQPNNQGGQGNGQGKRWKKKKFGRGGENRPPRPEPGNSIQQANGGRRQNRQGKQRGPRQFVGPMDHMYREVNGNYADTPASTIEMHGNVGARRQHHRREFNEDRLPPELLTNQRAIAIPEDAPTHIYFFVEELFLTAKINETARNQGVKVAFMKPEKEIVAHLAELPEHEHPSLIVFDLNAASMKALTLIPKIKAKLKKGTSIIGFLNLLQAGEVKMKAMEAGCNTVMTKAAFSQSLPNLIRRYGIEEEDEPNYNQ